MAAPFPDIKSKHSLVAKHVTKEKWDKLAHLKTKTSGFTLGQAIACAVNFDNQHCGIYAGDWDSYKDFAEVFDPIIQEYHGIQPGSMHTSNMNIHDIKGNIDMEVPVHSVRIRVGRSIDGFGLSPGITKAQRLGVEELMKKAFKELPGDLSGKYYPLTGMNEKTRQNLVDDHFLFMSGDKNLQVAGMERDWPEGRGIYHNKDKTFLVWVNEEDQLRIISMEMGGDVRGVFERLARGIKAVESSVMTQGGKRFALDPKYGFIHSCPTNLGTGMRASVHVDLPGWTKEGLPALQKRAEELKVQPRGTRGESGGHTGCTYDISNKHRLGYSEVQLVQCMIDGVNTLFKEDIALQKKHKIYPAMPEIKSKHSLVGKYVTSKLWKKLAEKKTATSGFTLARAIACATKFGNQHCGIYAGDCDSYKDFAEVFDPIIQDYHGIKPNGVHTSDMDYMHLKGNILDGLPVHSVRIRVGRNISRFGLSPGITKEQRKEVEVVGRNAFRRLKGDLAGAYYPLQGMAEAVRQQLVDDHFLFMSGDANLKVAGMERDWPEGRGIYHNKEKTFLAWINEEDQFRIISMQNGSDVRAVFERLSRGIKAIEESVKIEAKSEFAFDPKYGYIHSCPTNLGTGMRASVHIDLPGWTMEGLPALQKRCEELGLQPRGTRGESGGQTGFTYDISNKHRLGYTEVQLAQTMIDGVNRLYAADLMLIMKHEHKKSPALMMLPRYQVKFDPKVFPNIKSAQSLVAKHLTPQLWEKLAPLKTKTSGFTLGQAIACAAQFDNQHCGIYAGDWDSYKDFAEIFDPIIQEYHGIQQNAVHTSDMDVSKIQGNIERGVPVMSVRIRVGRSIDGFGLSPGITMEQRNTVESLMRNAFKKLTGDLEGNYYPLSGMEEKVRQQLVDDHFLFVSGDPNLQAAGMERDWPDGRGIFHNAAKTFLVWVNEEDQLRIISMEMGGDVRGVFERLARGIKAVGDSVKVECGKDFAYDKKYGYIHSCPTNLGTGMRASVHVDLPGWTKEGLPALQKRCEELKVQPRGTRGESGGQTGSIYDISNKHRLGYSEVQLVQCMIDGVNALYKEDSELQKKHDQLELQQMANASYNFPNIKSKHSLVAKHVTKDRWDKLCKIVTKTSGFTLSKAIACAVQFDNQHCGIYAGDWDSYKDFASVFDPVIQEYHGIKPDAKHVSDMDVTKIKGNINEGTPVKSVRIRVGRSIDGFGLSPGITKEQRLGVEKLMKSAFTKLSGDLAGNYYPLKGMDEKVQHKLIADHFLFMSGDPNLKVAGMERDWPEGRGIYHNAQKTFLVWVNEEDQLRIISMQMGGDVKGVFERLARGIKAVGDSVKAESGKVFAIDPKYGYIHSCPTNLGTGMRASVHVDLPGWTRAGLPALQKRCEELKVQPRGTAGESGGQTGSTYDISNKHRLGYSEVQLVQCMIDGVNKLYAEDQELMKKPAPAAAAVPFPNIKSKNSLVAKHVTKDKWSRLGSHVTKTSGFTLSKAIACAVEFDNQHCGIYAGDWDTYKDFAEVFDPLIQEYHGIKSDAKHTSDMDVSKIQGNIKEGIPVHSVRIRVGRSIDGFGLSPGITKDQRVGVEKLMKSAFTKLPGDLAGKYFPLTGMDEKIRQQLVDDHFLFVSGDPNLKVAGMERDWPEGRGIYHNAEKTFLVWVNEEDQLRIISMQGGGDVKGVFERLARGIKAVGDSVKKESGKDFALDPKYGYIHSCPTNLGTGMRASVHVDLPGWTAAGLDTLQKRCEELKVQPRGTRGESGGQTGVTYDISNKHRLGYSEVQLVQCMIDGVNKLYAEDLELQKKHKVESQQPAATNQSQQQKTTSGSMPFPDIKSKHSLVAKHVTKEKWNKLCGIVTKTSGFTLAKAIACTVNFDNQHCGIYAGDWDSYKDFASVFDPIIQEYHGIKPDAKHTSDMDVSKIQGNIKDGSPVHSVRIRVGRSIDGFGLSPGITKEQRLGVENLMKTAFKKLTGDLAGNYYALTGMDEKVRQQLVDDHFLFVSGDPNLKVAGMERDWPEGRGIYHNAEKTFLVWVNEEDQLRIISMQKGGDVKGVFERLARGIKAVGDSVKAESSKDFALDAKYGYIHSCPTNLGTGMRASVHVDLPGWTAKGLDALQKRCEELKVQPRGTRGESGGQTGCTYDISNKHRLGYSEVQLVQCMIDGVNKLYAEDLELQKSSGAGQQTNVQGASQQKPSEQKPAEAQVPKPAEAQVPKPAEAQVPTPAEAQVPKPQNLETQVPEVKGAEQQQASGGAPAFPDIKSKHSLVAKHVTKERWAKLGGHVTKTSGFTLAKAIACAVNFDNQHCGIYAGDWDSYKDFAEVFDPLIQEYHGIKADAMHTSDMDVAKIKGNIKDGVPVNSVRIRVGRSIDGFGLSPGITKEQRVGVENLMKTAFTKLSGDLAGKYFPLTGMDEKVRQQLVDDHFLFVSGDPNLQVAGMERDWPEGRGIYHNAEKTFLVWVNEEDQLRIISMQKGGDVKGVFERLARGIKAVGDSVKTESGKDFALDPKYGYIHSCPTNLGTGMRASVHVDLPGWTAAGLDTLKKRCEELKVQPRGTRGESGGQTGITYDISNKHRLGYSEVQLVQCMIDGVNALYTEDLELCKKHNVAAPAPAGPPFPDIKSKHSLVAKHVTKERWQKLAGHVTKTSGFTLEKAIACAVNFDNQHCGIYAGDCDSYKDFAEVFDPIIQEYHGIKPDAVHTSDMSVSKINGNINEDAPVNSVRIRVGRSISGFGLSPGITKEQRIGVENLMKSAFTKLHDDLEGKYYPLTGMDEKVRQQLVDDHFLFVSGDPNLKVAGMERDWPEGRGIFHNAAKTFLVWVNEEDQLRIISMQSGGDVKAVFERLVKGIRMVGDSVEAECGKDFAFDPKYGYVHSCPTNLGTGMRASVHVDLPGWTAEGLEALNKRCEALKLQPRGTRGESGGQTGCTFDISNKHRLGYSEVELVQCMIDGVNTLHKEDLELQKKHNIKPFPKIKSKDSLVAKYLTRDVWSQLCDLETKTSKFTIEKAVACAVKFNNQATGIFAGDVESYKDFAVLFDPIIHEYHGIKPDAVHKSNLDPSALKGNVNPEFPVKSVRVRVGRSITGFGLSAGITKQERLQVEDILKKAFAKLSGDLGGSYCSLVGMGPDCQQQLVNDHFLFASGDETFKAAGMFRDWPEGRGIYLNNDKTFIVWVNEEDHMCIISMEKGGDVKKVFERLSRGIQAIEEAIKAESGKEFAFDEKYGYIHSCPTNLGTGMRASVHIDLPGYAADGIASLQKRCKSLNVEPRSVHGEAGKMEGVTFDISNKHRLGYTELQLIQTMVNGVNTLCAMDLVLQKKHLKNGH